MNLCRKFFFMFTFLMLNTLKREPSPLFRIVRVRNRTVLALFFMISCGGIHCSEIVHAANNKQVDEGYRLNCIKIVTEKDLIDAEKSAAANSSDLALSLNNIAGIYYAQGLYAEAEPLFLRALAIREKTLGSSHPDLATSLNNMAELYKAQSRYVEAEPLYNRALAISEKIVPADNLDVAVSLNNLAEYNGTLDKFDVATSLSLRALAIREKLLGQDHPDVAMSLNNLGRLYFAQGRYALARLWSTANWHNY